MRARALRARAASAAAAAAAAPPPLDLPAAPASAAVRSVSLRPARVVAPRPPLGRHPSAMGDLDFDYELQGGAEIAQEVAISLADGRAKAGLAAGGETGAEAARRLRGRLDELDRVVKRLEAALGDMEVGGRAPVAARALAQRREAVKKLAIEARRLREREHASAFGASSDREALLSAGNGKSYGRETELTREMTSQEMVQRSNQEIKNQCVGRRRRRWRRRRRRGARRGVPALTRRRHLCPPNTTPRLASLAGMPCSKKCRARSTRSRPWAGRSRMRRRCRWCVRRASAAAHAAARAAVRLPLPPPLGSPSLSRARA